VKILLKPTINRALARGERGRLYYRIQRLSRDTDLNRLVKYALSIIAASSSNSETHDLAVSAGYLLYHLSDVSITPPVAVWAHGLRNSERDEKTRILVELGAAVIENIVPLHDVRAAALFPLAAFIRLERLFETAVYEAVRKLCLKRPGYAATRYTVGSERHYVFEDTVSYAAEPDVIVRGPGCVLIDAKYRDFSAGVPHDAIYQLIAHCEAFGIKEALLVGLAEESPPGERLLGTTRSGIRVSAALVHPAHLEEQLNRVVERAILRAESAAAEDFAIAGGLQRDSAEVSRFLSPASMRTWV
jgi:5-methylcytosine-specific restriction endonuclease McrBC regulatory subunit McrC